MTSARFLFRLALVTFALPGCVYYNGLYNARRAFEEGERARLQGDTRSAIAEFGSASEGANRAWIEEPEGDWADDALLLTARSAIRLGDASRAREALELIREALPDPVTARRADLMRGALKVLDGLHAEAVGLVSAALVFETSASWRGEGHLWLARAHLGSGDVEAGFREFDRAVEADPRLERAAALEVLDRAIERGDRARAEEGAGRLFREPQGAAWADSILTLTRAARRVWGSGGAAGLLTPLREGAWRPEPRDRLLLHRADMLLESGDTATAAEELEWIAEGAGTRASEARLALADLRLSRATTFAELVRVRRVLLPVNELPQGRDRLLRIGEVEVLAIWGTRGDPVAYFVAGEIARDELGALRLAHALFLTAAELDEEGPWAGKALLAAIALADTPELRARLLRRVAQRRRDPYASRLEPGYHGSELYDLWETELTYRVREIRALATAEAVRFVPSVGGSPDGTTASGTGGMP